MRKGHAEILKSLDQYYLTKEQTEVIKSEYYPLYFYDNAIECFHYCNKRGYNPKATTKFVIDVFETLKNERVYVKNYIAGLFMQFYIKSPKTMKFMLKIKNIGFLEDNLHHLGSMSNRGVPYETVKKVVFDLLGEEFDGQRDWNESTSNIIERKCCTYLFALQTYPDYDLVKTHLDHFPAGIMANYYNEVKKNPGFDIDGIEEDRMKEKIHGFMDATVAYVKAGLTWEDAHEAGKYPPSIIFEY